MPTPVPACRCGYRPCTADQDAAIHALWQHIEEAHLPISPDPHQGRYVWRNGAELAWECDDDCPHPTHEEQPMNSTDAANEGMLARLRCGECGGVLVNHECVDCGTRHGGWTDDPLEVREAQRVIDTLSEQLGLTEEPT